MNGQMNEFRKTFLNLKVFTKVKLNQPATMHMTWSTTVNQSTMPVSWSQTQELVTVLSIQRAMILKPIGYVTIKNSAWIFNGSV